MKHNKASYSPSEGLFPGPLLPALPSLVLADWLPLSCSACCALTSASSPSRRSFKPFQAIFPLPCIFIISSFYLVFEYWIRTSERCLRSYGSCEPYKSRVDTYALLLCLKSLRFSGPATTSQTHGSCWLL